jgi:hypothetical protein
MNTKHINEYKLFPIHSIPDGTMFIPKTDSGIDENTYVYTKISDYSVEMYMGYAIDEDDPEHYVYALNSDGEIECFNPYIMVYCVGEYDYKLCL